MRTLAGSLQIGDRCRLLNKHGKPVGARFTVVKFELAVYLKHEVTGEEYRRNHVTLTWDGKTRQILDMTKVCLIRSYA